MPYKATRRVETTTRSFEIIQFLRQNGKTGVSTVASELDMNKGIVHNHLSTLRELGYVRTVGTQYELSAKLFALGVQTRAASELYQYGVGLTEDFAARFDVGVVLVAHTEDECIVIAGHGLSRFPNLRVGAALSRYDSLVGIVTLTDDDSQQAGHNDVFEALETHGYSSGRLSEDLHTHCVAFPIVDDAGICRGSVGILTDDDTEDRFVPAPLENLRDRIEKRFESGWTADRSFATEKHSWVWE